MPDYLPGPDNDFTSWTDNFVAYANANLAALGLVAGDMVPVASANTDWKTSLADHVAAAAAAKSARQTKDEMRATLEGLIRPLVKRLQASPEVDNAERQSLGITVPDTISTPVGAPSSTLIVRIESPARLRHIIHFSDSVTPTSRAKPPGVLGAEVWLNLQPIGQPTPTDPASFTFVALDTKTPYTIDFQAAEGGKNAHYLLRWVNSKGDKGPWSETASATVGA